MIALADYWMGRDATHSHLISAQLLSSASLTVALANDLLDAARAAGLRLVNSPRTGTPISSGWRPPDVNAAIPNAAVNSKHLTAQAVDLYDPDGELDEWLMSQPGQLLLGQLGLWMEHPSATKGWAHVQTVPPRSGRRVFYP